jgi:MscS family membrane protein
MPNSKLANERLINLMQPTPELISAVPVMIARDSDVERVRQILNDTMDGHPDLMGDIPTKLQRIPDFSILTEAKRSHGIERLRAELAVDQTVNETAADLRRLAGQISRAEQGGISRVEQQQFLEAFDPIARRLGELPRVQKRLDAYHGALPSFVDACMTEVESESLAARTHRWIEVWTRDPDIVLGEDDVRLREQWSSRLISLWRRIDETRRRIERMDGLEQRLDDAVLRLAGWASREFKQPMPPWKASGASFKGLEDGGFRFNLYFFIDNIELEHFWRQARVEAELRREIVRRLRREGIEFASPRYELAFLRGEPAAEAPARVPAGAPELSR